LKQIRSMRVTLLSLLFACAPPPTRPQLLAGPIQKSIGCAEGPEVTDALGQPVHLGDRELTTVVIFLSRGAADEAADFVRQLDEQLLNRPVQMVGIVDLHKYSVVRRLAQQRLKKSAEESRQKRRDRRKARGVDASDTFVGRWHVIGDFDGGLLARYGVSPEPSRPVAFVVGTCGGRVGPLHEVAETLRAVDQAAARSARRDASFRRRARAQR
jgi:hypothetical protein